MGEVGTHLGEDWNITEPGTADGQVLYWDNAAGVWKHTETNELAWDDVNKRFGIGIVPYSLLHIRGDAPGVVGNSQGGQLIIQATGISTNSNAVITGYNSDIGGLPDTQLWYMGSSSGSNANIVFLNRQNASLSLGTNGGTWFTLTNTGSLVVPRVYADTDPGAVNVRVGSDGHLVRSTSSRKIKKNIVSNVKPDWALKFKPVTFDAKSNGSKHVGFIAEDMAAVDSRFSSGGVLPGLELNAIVAALTALVQRHQKQIKKLQAKVA